MDRGRDSKPGRLSALMHHGASASLGVPMPVITGAPRVTLRHASARPYDDAIAAARTCYSPRVVAPEEVTEAQRESIGPLTFEGGHHTVFQHAHFEFGLENVSRQFVWSFLHSHPFYNSEQSSQRFVKLGEARAHVPESLTGEARSVYEAAIESAWESYGRLTTLLREDTLRIVGKLRHLTPAASDKRRKKVEREVFEFQRLKAPFSVGHGQFVLDDSYVRGPLLGASIRGKVDYNRRSINLGGTYVPLQGINSALCEIPLVGPIVSGFDCQGVFGITYAIQGSMSQPQVLVNPLSMFTPGILRGIMEMTTTNPQVQPLREQQRAPANQRVRASSSGPEGTVDGWSSETMPAAKKDGAKKK